MLKFGAGAGNGYAINPAMHQAAVSIGLKLSRAKSALTGQEKRNIKRVMIRATMRDIVREKETGLISAEAGVTNENL